MRFPHVALPLVFLNSSFTAIVSQLSDSLLIMRNQSEFPINHILFSRLAKRHDFLQELGAEWVLSLRETMILVWLYLRTWIKNICVTNLMSCQLSCSFKIIVNPSSQS